MNTNRFLFLAHDPGGHDVTQPLVKWMIADGISCSFFCVGPAAKLNPQFATTEEQLFEAIANASFPTIFVCGTSWGTDLELRAMIACRSQGIKTVAVLDFWSNYRERFLLPNEQYVFSDYLVVMDEMARDEAAKVGVPESIIRVLGQPGLDKWVEMGRTVSNFEHHSMMRVLLLTQPLSKLYGNRLGYTEKEVCHDVLKAIRTELNDEVRIKFHPKDDEYLRNTYSFASIEGELDCLFAQFDVIVGMSSIGLLQASLAGRKVISYQPNMAKEDMAITNKLGLTRGIFSFPELVAELDRVRETLMGSLSVEIAQRQVLNAIWMDGHSTDRVIRFIKEVAE